MRLPQGVTAGVAQSGLSTNFVLLAANSILSPYHYAVLVSVLSLDFYLTGIKSLLC